MDDKFADRMSDLADLNEETLTQRWATLKAVVNDADESQTARLVLLACGAEWNREEDEWFWAPFREKELTIPVDDGAQLFMRLAECGARYLIEVEELPLPAMYVRLACLAGYSPFHQDLLDASLDRLQEAHEQVADYAVPASAWTPAVQKALEAAPSDIDTLSAQFVAFASAAQKALAASGRQLVALSRWAADADRRFGNEQGLIQWLLNGVRIDGASWKDLPAATVAVDAAYELAGFIDGAPQPRHEATIAQVLMVADKSGGTVSGDVEGVLTRAAGEAGDDCYGLLTPLSQVLARGGELPELMPLELAVRVLWETATTAARE